MMKRTLNIILISCMCGSLGAQDTMRWSMDDCMQYAIEHSADVQQQRFEVSSQKADVWSALGRFLPSVSAGVGGQLNWGRGIDPETNTYTNITTFNNGYSVSASLTLFDGGQTINQWKQAQAARRQGLTNLQRAKDDKAIEVMQAFVDLAYKDACVRLAVDKLNESRQTLHKTETQEELGIKGKPDVALIAAQVAADDYNLTHQQNQREVAETTLKKLMNYPVDEPLCIDTLLYTILPMAESAQADDIYEYALHNNPVALSSAWNMKNLQLNYQIARGRLFPSISLQAGVTTSYFRNLSDGTEVASFSSQFKNNRGEYVSASLSIPIFDGFSRNSSVQRARNEWQKAKLQREETLRQLQADIAQALMDCNGYAKEVIKLERKVNADALAYQLTKRKYEEGMLDAIDLQTSGNTLLQSRISLLQSRLLYVLKQRLVSYYKGGSLLIEN